MHDIVAALKSYVKGKKPSQPKKTAGQQRTSVPPVADGPLDLTVSRQSAVPSSASHLPSSKVISEPALDAEIDKVGEVGPSTGPIKPPASQASTQEVTSFRCCFCGLSFTSTDVLLQHIRIHTGDEEGESRDGVDDGKMGNEEDGDSRQTPSRVSPDTVSGSTTSPTGLTTKLIKSTHPETVASPKVLITPSTDDPMGAEEESSQSPLPDGNLTSEQYLTTTCEADSTVEIPMSVSKAKLLEPSTSTSHALQNSSCNITKSTSKTAREEESRAVKYQCPICRSGFSNHLEQQQHQLSCRPPSEKQFFLQSFSLSENLTCLMCKIRFPSADAKSAHHCHGLDKSVQGFNYMYSISDQITSQRHIDAGPGNLSSDVYFSSSLNNSWTGGSSSLEKDTNPASGRSTPESKKGRYCEGCDKSFEFSRNLSRHLQCNPTCRAVMVAKDPGSVKKGGYRFSFMKSKSVEESAPGSPEQSREVQNLDLGAEFRFGKRGDKSWSPTGYSCKVCGKHFKDGLKLGVHTRWEHREGVSYSKPKGKKWKHHKVRKSVRNLSDKVVSCRACQKTFKLESHLELHLTLKKKCRVQHAKVVAAEGVDTAGASQDSPDPDDKRPICKICHRRYWSMWHLKSHMKACHSEIQPRQGNSPVKEGLDNVVCRQFYQVEHVPEAYQHLDLVNNEFRCKFCKQRFHQKKIGYNHVLIHLKINPYGCLLCNYRGRQIACILKHLKNNHHDALQHLTAVTKDFGASDVVQEKLVHDEHALDLSSTSAPTTSAQEETASQPLPSNLPEVGTVENVDFVYSPSTNEADLCQLVPGGYKCPFCEALYGSKSRTVCHIRKHTKARPYKCCYCSFTASYSYMIYQHLRKQHFKNRPVRAPARGRGRGRGRHMPSSPARLQSPKVGAQQPQVSPGDSKFPKNAMYYSSFFKALPIDKQYTPIQVPDSDLWKCYACEKTSMDQSVILTHALTHSQLKPFHCLLCSHKSARLGMLISHLQDEHKGELEAHFGRNAQFDDANLEEHAMEIVPANDIQDLHMINDNSTEVSNQEASPSNKPTPSSPTKNQTVSIELRRRSSRGRQIKPQKSLQDDYVYDFTESESDTSQHRNSPMILNFGESGTHPETQPVNLHKTAQAGEIAGTPSKQAKTSSDAAAAKDGGPTPRTPLKFNVVVLPGSRERIYLCPHCNFKSNYESVIQAHLALKHNRGQSLSEFKLSQGAKSVSMTAQVDKMEGGSQKNVLGWFPHQWNGSGDGTNTGNVISNQQPAGDSNNQMAFKLQDSAVITADEDRNKEMMDTANTLYSYKAGPAERSANFDNEPQGGFKCGFCKERPQGKAAAIAHLQGHTDERPYCCDICDVKEADRGKILNHIQQTHSIQVLDILVKKRKLLETSLRNDTSTDALADGTADLGDDDDEDEEANSADEDATSADDIDMNDNSPNILDAEIQLSNAVPITQMLGSVKGFRMNNIRKKNLSFYKQIIFIRGPKEDKLHIEQDKITGRCICPYCKKTFSGRNATKQHSRIHTHEKPYYCKLCYHNARNISSIMKHLQAVHKNECKSSRGAPKVGKMKLRGGVKVMKTDVKDAQILKDGKEQDQEEEKKGERNKEDEKGKEEQTKSINTSEEIKRPQSPSQILQEFFEFQPGEVEKNLQLQVLADGRCKCPFCNRIQVNSFNTKRHIRIHTEERPYLCKLCNFKAIQYSVICTHLFKKHAEEEKIADFCAHKGEMQGEEKDDEFIDDEEIEELPVDMSSPRPMTDQIQGANVKMLQDLRTKQGIVGFQPPGKRQWNARWTNYYVYEPGPVEEKYKDTRRHVPSGCFRCPLCKKNNIQEKGKFLSHLRVHSGEKAYRCKLCGYKAGQQSTIVHHVSSYHKLDVQQEDERKGISTSTKIAIRKRWGKESGTMPVGSDASDDRLAVDQSPETSPEKANAENQTDAISPKEKPWEYIPGEIETNLKVQKDMNDDYTCPYCVRTGFKIIRSLKAHVRTHTNEMPYRCKKCEYTCRQQSSMRYHASKAHKIAPAEVSTGSGSLADVSKEVAALASTGVSSFEGVVQKATDSSGSVGTVDESKISEEVEVNEDGTKDFGQYTFTRGKMEKRVQLQVSQLQRDVVTGSYLCSYCVQGFGSKYSYVVHVRTHTGEKPYACKMCGYHAAQHNSMKWHIKTQHKPSRRRSQSLVEESVHVPTPEQDQEEEGSLLVEELPQVNDSQPSTLNQSREPETVHTCKMHEGDARAKSLLEDVCVNSLANTNDRVEIIDSTKETEAMADGRSESNPEELPHGQDSSFHQDEPLEKQFSSPTSHTALKQPQCVYMHKVDSQVVENYLAENETISGNIARLFYTFSVGMVERNLNIEIDRSSNQFICPFCQGLFPSLEAVRKHGRLHTGERPYCCNLCTRQEFNESKIIQHIVDRHKSAVRKAARKGTPIPDRPEKEEENTEDESNVHQVWGCISPHVTYTVDIDKRVCYVCDLCKHKIAGYPQIITHLTRYHKVDVPNPERAIREDQAIVAANYDQQTEDMDVSPSLPAVSRKSPRSASTLAVRQISPGSAPTATNMSASAGIQISPSKTLVVDVSPRNTLLLAINQVSPRNISAFSQVSPRNTSAFSQVSPRNASAVSQVSPRNASAVSQVSPRNASPVSQVSPRNASAASQVSPRNTYVVSQVSPRNTSAVSQVSPRNTSAVSQVSPRNTSAVSQVSPRNTSAVNQVSPRNTSEVSQVSARNTTVNQVSIKNTSTLAVTHISPRSTSALATSQLSPQSMSTPIANHVSSGNTSTPTVTQPKQQLASVEKVAPAVNTSLFAVDEKQKLVVINHQDKVTKQSFVCNKCGHMTLQQDDMMTHITEMHPEAVLYVNPMNPQENAAPVVPVDLQNVPGLNTSKPADGRQRPGDDHDVDNITPHDVSNKQGDVLKEVQSESIKSDDDEQVPETLTPQDDVPEMTNDNLNAGIKNPENSKESDVEMPKTLASSIADVPQAIIVSDNDQKAAGIRKSSRIIQGVENIDETKEQTSKDFVSNDDVPQAPAHGNTPDVRRSSRITKIDDQSNNLEIPETLASKDEAPQTQGRSETIQSVSGISRLDRIINKIVENSKERNTQVIATPITSNVEPQTQLAGISDENAVAVRRSDRNLNRSKKLEMDATANETSAGSDEVIVAAEQGDNKEPSEDTAKMSPRSAIEHNYARSKVVGNNSTEVSSETTGKIPVSSALEEIPAAASIGISPRRRGRRRSTRRNSSELPEAKMVEMQSRENLSSVPEKEGAATASNPAMSLQLPLPQAGDVIKRTKSRELESNASSDHPASESSSITDKINDDNVDETSISNYFTVTIGNTEKSLGRNIQRDKATGFYLCPYCDKSARLLQTTKIHVRLHTGEKPYQCKLCDVKTVQHCSIITHIKNHHPDILGIKPKEPRKTKKRSRQVTSSHENPMVPMKLANRVKKLGSTSPMKTKYKKVSKTLKIAEEDESFVDLQRSQQIYEEAKQMETLTGLQKKKISPSDGGMVIKSEGIGISGLRRFAQIPIPKLGVANLTQQFMKVAMEKDQTVEQDKTSSGGIVPVTEKPDAAPVPDETSANGALDLSVHKQKETSAVESSVAQSSGITSSSRTSPPVQIEQPADEKMLKRKKNRRKRRGKKLKRKKVSDDNDEEQLKTKKVKAVVGVKDKGNHGNRYSKDSFLEKYYTIDIGPIEKSLTFEKDPVTKRTMCPYCSMTLSHIWSAYNHVRLHTGERPFRCNLCNYAAVQLTSIKTHLYKTHKCVIGVEPQNVNSTGEKSDTGPTRKSAGPKSNADLPKSIDSLSSIRSGPINNEDTQSTSIGADDTSTRPMVSNSKDVPAAPFNVYNCFSFIAPVEVTSQNYEKDPATGFMICPHCDDPIARRTLVEHICGHTGDLPYRCKACEHKTAKRSAMIRHIQMYHKEDSFSKYVPHPGNEAPTSSTKMDEDPQEPSEKLSESSPKKLSESSPKKLKKKSLLRVKYVPHPGNEASTSNTKMDEDPQEPSEKLSESTSKKLKKKSLLRVKLTYKKPDKATSEIVKDEGKKECEESEGKKECEESGFDQDETTKELMPESNLEEAEAEETSKLSSEQHKLCQFYSLKVSKKEKNLVIHKIGRSSYACPFCPNSFVRSADAKRHARVHTGDNPYKCKLCAKETRQQGAMLKHIERMHATEVASATEKECENDNTNGGTSSNIASFTETSQSENQGKGDEGNADEKTESNVSVTETSPQEKACGDDEENVVEGTAKEVFVAEINQSEEQNKSCDGNVPEENASHTGSVGETSQIEKEVRSDDADVVKETVDVSKTSKDEMLDMESEGGAPNLSEIAQEINTNNEMMAQSNVENRNHVDPKIEEVHLTEKDSNIQIQKTYNESEMYSSDEQSCDAFPEGAVGEERKPIEDILEQLWTDVDDDDHTGDEEHPEEGQVCDKEGNEPIQKKAKTGLSADINQGNDDDNQGKDEKSCGEQKMDVDEMEDGKNTDQTMEVEKNKGAEDDERIRQKEDKMREQRQILIGKGVQETASTAAKVQLVEIPKVDEYEFEDEPFSKNQRKQTRQRRTPVKDINKKSKSPSPGPSSSYYGNRSTPPSPAGRRMKGSPRGSKTLHYSFEPTDEDTYNVVMEGNIAMFQCPHCTYKHRTKSVVRIHIRTHTKHKPYYCHYCDFNATHGTTMKRHLFREHSIGTDPMISDVDISQSKSPNESPHFKFRPSKEEKTLVLTRDKDGFVCSYCDRPFTTEGNLRIHIRTHTGDKPYQCRYCEFKTAYGFVMQKHINMTHKDQPSDPNDDKPIVGLDYTFNPSEQETSRVLRRCPGSDIYKCEVCGRESVHEYDAVAHLRSHTGDTPYHCAHCDTHTMTQLQIIKHVTNMHKPIPKKP
ncbi:uncharacterized protein [Amphiura filiformis]|uniref:uncharacterized protein n=1 Tax=Amphiura filiformis TaxID=82378 RepID=UPI003B21F6CA